MVYRNHNFYMFLAMPFPITGLESANTPSMSNKASFKIHAIISFYYSIIVYFSLHQLAQNFVRYFTHICIYLSPTLLDFFDLI